MNTTIDKALNIAPVETEETFEVVNVQPSANNMDFEYARGNLINAIEKGQQALTDVVDVASRSQSPKTFEAVAQILNAVTTANKELLDLSKKKLDIQKMEATSQNPTTINNNLFVGSTAELLKLMKDNGTK